jgi:peptide-methionine (S)-S-oxide reductase
MTAGNFMTSCAGVNAFALAPIRWALRIFFPAAAAALFAMNALSESNPARPQTQLATLGGGCFWCVEAVFETFEGVHSVISGYAGGKTPNPTYKEISTGKTGHAEVVQVEFDPAKITYEQLLEIFWETHDPTTLNRQGADVGTQYRSIILFHNDEQKRAAETSRKNAAPMFNKPIVTEIVPLEKFHRAEDYHQDYFRKNPDAPYCIAVISPKLQKLQKVKEKITRPAD